MKSLSPYTGLTRAEWVDLGDRMLAAVRPYSSDHHAQINLPGPEGAYGHAVDGLEGFARTFLLAAFRLAGDGGQDPKGLAEWYAAGIEAGTDPASADRWVRLDEHPQAKVEAASIALALDMTRPWIWDQLDAAVRQRVVDYLAPAVGDHTYPRINWIWFRLVVQTFLRGVGGPHDLGEMAEDLATHDSFVKDDGWLADGEERSYDHYVGWALHLYPVLWSRMSGAAGLAEQRTAADISRLDRYLLDAVRLIGSDGAPLAQGRSLIYRFAAAAPFWVGAMASVPSLSPGLLRRAASGIVGYFVEHGVPDDRGLLTLGWFDEWIPLRQRYSGPGSPYWAVKGMLGLALPAHHPVWTATEEPLPVESADQLFSVSAPGWLASATRADGIVRISNHGTDHSVEGSTHGDSPLYARLGYSTASFPLLDESAWVNPLDQSVGLVDSDGRATHRAGMRTLALEVQSSNGVDVGTAASIARVHWLAPAADQQRHGSGYVGESKPAGTITTLSLLRGPWEVRVVRLEELADTSDRSIVALRIAGWAVSGSEVRVGARQHSAFAEAAGVVARMHALTPAIEASTAICCGASPLGVVSATPWLLFTPQLATWAAAIVELTTATAPHTYDLSTCAATIGGEGVPDTLTVAWPDGLETRHDLHVVNCAGISGR